MIALFGVAVALVAGLCILAYALAVYALPFMLGVEAAIHILSGDLIAISNSCRAALTEYYPPFLP
jgi:hypothetical protein